MVSDIVEWLQCFGIYIAIISRKQPARVIDLLGYQNLIIQAYQEYRGDCWLEYDRGFRQQAAATPTRWAVVDPTLWNLAFSGQAGTSRCRYCLDCHIVLVTVKSCLPHKRSMHTAQAIPLQTTSPQTTSHHT